MGNTMGILNHVLYEPRIRSNCNCNSGVQCLTRSGCVLESINEHDIDMKELERRLDGLLQDRKGKGRFRQLREYDGSELIDFVCPLCQVLVDLC